MEVPANILERIKKLLIFAEDAKKRDSQAELENAMSKANTLMMEYNLSVDKIDISQQKKAPVEMHKVGADVLFPKNEGGWIIKLYQCIARFNFCTVITHDMGKHGLSLIGQAHNREIVLYIIDQLVVRIRNMARQAFREYQGNEKRGTFLRGYLLGCVQGLREKLQAERDAEHTNEITALILVKDKDVQEFVKKEFPSLVYAKGSSTSSQAGKSMGIQAGRSMSINKGVGTNAGGQRMLN